MKCCECNLYFADDPSEMPYCHADPNWLAPCEYEDDWDDYDRDYEPDYDECGFDPYEGCYTYDC